ncbi:hypothetical protein ACFPM3_33650 [Streptomyces coeruleoprunus]|uniref:DUF2550 family protein n=1 Tax=Streptomyces coeruleoprunus TaxID=285563 RepID=A0ABV9XRI9_9ACTN
MSLVLVAALIGLAFRAAGRQRAARVAAGGPAGFPCMLRGPGGRWKPGRLRTGPGPLVWKPSLGGRPVDFPEGLRHTGTRRPTVKESVVLNPRARILECTSPAGPVQLAVMPEELDAVLAQLGDPV